MSPKERARELVNKFNCEIIGNTYTFYQNFDESKRCALIAVNEIISLVGRYNNNYWNEVKNEIENL